MKKVWLVSAICLVVGLGCGPDKSSKDQGLDPSVDQKAKQADYQKAYQDQQKTQKGYGK
jgi:hypothetical protein